MTDSLLSPAVGGTFWAGSVAVLAYSCRQVQAAGDDERIPLMGVTGAFIFAAQMVNFTIPGTGSSGHLLGGLFLAALLGPCAGFIVISSVLTAQALFFADGGLLALGCNIWNMGFYSCFIAYPFIFKPLLGREGSSRRIRAASLIAAIVALQLGAFSVVMETWLSGRSELPFRSFLWFMQPIHLAIGLVEGVVTAGMLNAVKRSRPELLDGRAGNRKLLLVFLFLALFTGGILSWFSSTRPDGLEWAILQVKNMRNH